jgi:1,2-diacylglycerol 3-beta-galactosyltransferase
MLIDVIPGQETGNANYVIRGDAGVLANNPTEVLEAMCHWFENDRALYNQQALNALRLGRPLAAFDTAKLVWSLAASHEEEPMTL